MLPPYQFFYKLMALPFIEAIWLYGSRAREDNTELSDIDLAILCPEASEEDWSHVLEIIENADTLLDIDCIRLDDCPDDKLKKNILKFKRVLYEKGSGFMEKEFWKESFDSLGDAIARFEEIMTHPDLDAIDYLQDAAIQRFEFCIELYWKVLKRFLAYEEIDATTPREVVNKSFQNKLIADESLWFKMMKDRNITSHVYKQEKAKRVFQNLRAYLPVFQSTYDLLKIRYNNNLEE